MIPALVGAGKSTSGAVSPAPSKMVWGPGSTWGITGCHTPRKKKASRTRDRKSTRLNSSHSQISYAVFCLKKKKNLTNRSEEHTSELQSKSNLVCSLMFEEAKNTSGQILTPQRQNQQSTKRHESDLTQSH